MAEQDFGAAQPIADAIKGVYKKGNDLVQMIPGFGTKPVPAPPEPSKSIPEDNPNMKAWQDATKFKGPSNQIPTQTKAQQRPDVAPKVQIKSSLKVMPRKR
jgi:hypothetical protein